MSCGVGRRCGSDPTLLWLWGRLAATALIRPIAWEPPYAAGGAQEMAIKDKKKKEKKTYFRNKGLMFFSVTLQCHDTRHSSWQPQTWTFASRHSSLTISSVLSWILWSWFSFSTCSPLFSTDLQKKIYFFCILLLPCLSPLRDCGFLSSANTFFSCIQNPGA